MRVARVRLHLFRGYAEQVISPARHAVVVGEPRAGRSDLIMGLRRALDPRSWSRTPDLTCTGRTRGPGRTRLTPRRSSRSR